MNQSVLSAYHRLAVAFAFSGMFFSGVCGVSGQSMAIACPSDIVTLNAPGSCNSAPVIFAANATGTPQPTVRYYLGANEITSPATFPVGTNSVIAVVSNGQDSDVNCGFNVIVRDVDRPLAVKPADALVEFGQSTLPGSTGVATAVDCSGVSINSSDVTPVSIRTNGQLGWVLARSNGGVSPLTASAIMVDGPSNPPLGSGSAQLAIGTNVAGFAQLRTTNFNGTLLRNVTELSYSSHGVQGGAGGNAVFLLLSIDNTGDGVEDDALVFEPRYQVPAFNPALPNQGVPQTGIWQRWDAAAGGWWSSNAVGGMVPGSGVKALSAYLAQHPNAALSRTNSGSLRLVAGFGGTTWSNFTGNVDAVTVGTNGISSTHDFNLSTNAAPCPVKQVITRVWTATDADGNTDAATQLITVRDTTGPVLNCPANISKANDPGVCGATVNFTVTANDPSPFTVTSSRSSGSLFPVGITTVTNVAVDSCGNSNVCTFTVTVSDVQAPSIVCPADIVSVVATNVNQLAVNFVVSATDNCSAGVVSTPASGSMFPVGTTVVKSVATDSAGNTNQCSFNVVIHRRPNAGIDRLGTTEGRAATVSVAKLLANDRDLDGDGLNIISVSNTSTNGGSVALIGDSVTYTPLPGFSGMDQFSYVLTDSRGATNAGLVVVSVLAGGAPSRNQVSLTETANGMLVRFAGVPGESYIVQKASFPNGPWTDLAPPITADSVGLIEVLDSELPLPPIRFYRTIGAP